MATAEEWRAFDDPPGCIHGARLLVLRARDGSVKACALVDDADYPELSQFKWHWRSAVDMVSRKRSVSEGGGAVVLHRQLCGLEVGDGLEVDHRNWNRLDNRRSNLRVCTHAENAQNVRRVRGSSCYRGVTFRPACSERPWCARVQSGGREIYSRCFATEDEAGEAAAVARRELLPFSIE